MFVAQDSEFTALLEEQSRSLASFILALVGDRHVADDLFQSTCLEIWRIRRTFRPGTNFGAWARTVARYQVRRFWRKAGREKLAFSSESIDRVAEAYEAGAPDEEDETRKLQALEQCMASLEAGDRDLLRRRYNDGMAIQRLALETSQSEGGVKMALLRLRRKLERCVKARLAREGPRDG
jgi:RNA polymerase sigma-70 factor (ECF subfamily)